MTDDLPRLVCPFCLQSVTYRIEYGDTLLDYHSDPRNDWGWCRHGCDYNMTAEQCDCIESEAINENIRV